MFQPRRLSPASSSPLQRNLIVQQPPIKVHIKQITPTNNGPLAYQKYIADPITRPISRDREVNNSQSNYQNTFESYHSQYQVSNSIQNYIDTMLKTQKLEFQKILDKQNKSIEFMQQIILSQVQQQPQTFTSLIQQSQIYLEEKILQIINEKFKEIMKYEKQQDAELLIMNQQLEKLKTQIFQINLTNSKLISEKLHQSLDEFEECKNSQYKKNIQLKNDDQLIENQFNFCNKMNNLEYNNIPIKYSKSVSQSLQNSKLSKVSKQQENSPIELFDQNLLDSLDNIKVFDPNSQQDDNFSIQQNDQKRMSTIHENEYEEDDAQYKLEEFGRNKRSNALNKVKQFKSKTLYY